MPRPHRIWFPEALYHLTIRGDNREPIFFIEEDHRKYLRLLGDAKQRYGCQLFAYALMTNHVHLMVQTGQTYPVSKLMQSVNTAYTIYMNKKYKRVGHIFQGRYHSVLVQKDSYALELSRYIHLNPVRAGMVRAPEQYRWSSYRAYVGKEQDRLVNAEELLGMMSPLEAEQRALYTQFVMDGLAMRRQVLEDGVLTANQILGTPEFISMVKEGARPLAQKHAIPMLGV
jgi:REP element-mobilizing transposase RayT